MKEYPTDLFGEVIITHDDLYAWVAAVAPRWLYPERSYRNYLRTYDIAGKVRYAKLTGQFQQIVDSRYKPWHPKLAISEFVTH